MTPADHLPATDDARVEWEHYCHDYDVHPSDLTVSHRAFFAGWRAAAEWAAGRAETTTATTEDAQTGTFEAILAAHRDEYDSDCGMYFGCSCGWDNDDIGSNEGYVEHVAGLLATARTRPTREHLIQVLAQHDPENTLGDAADWYYTAQADAVLALLADQPTEAEAGARAVSEMGDWFMRQGFDRDVTAAQACYERAARIRGGDDRG